ncbi:MAG: gliding motility lipoprotein GldH [Flavobacteriaceae bacterium]
MKKITRNKKFLFYNMLLLFLVCSCHSEKGYTEYKSLANEGLGTSAVVFELPKAAVQSGSKNVFLRLQNNNSYPFANIFLLVSLTAGDELVIQDTLEYAMAAPDGTWLGKGFTEVKESKLWWKEGVVFPEKRPLKIKVAQAVRNNGSAEGVSTLKGILSVGISIEDQ